MQNIFPPDGLEDRFIKLAANAHSRRARLLDLVAFVTAFRDYDQGDRPHRLWPTFYLFHLSQEQALEMLKEFRTKMLAQKLALSTINRRLATLRAWVRYGQGLRATRLSPDQLMGDMIQTALLRSKQIDSDAIFRLCALPDVSHPRGLRDAAMLQLLCEVPLLSWQLCSLRTSDVLEESRELRIPVVNCDAYADEDKKPNAKTAQEPQYATVGLSHETLGRVREYLSQNQLQGRKEAPLFINFDRRPGYKGRELVPKSVLHLVKEYGKQAGIFNLNPRSIRICAINLALEKANGKASAAFQRFPHVGLHTWFHYGRENGQP